MALGDCHRGWDYLRYLFRVALYHLPVILRGALDYFLFKAAGSSSVAYRSTAFDFLSFQTSSRLFIFLLFHFAMPVSFAHADPMILHVASVSFEYLSNV